MDERGSATGQYRAPELTEFGSVAAITQSDKIGEEQDQFSQGTSLDGSIVPDS